MERKEIMMWMLTWLNVSTSALNVTLQLLVIYRFGVNINNNQLQSHAMCEKMYWNI